MSHCLCHKPFPKEYKGREDKAVPSLKPSSQFWSDISPAIIEVVYLSILLQGETTVSNNLKGVRM